MREFKSLNSGYVGTCESWHYFFKTFTESKEFLGILEPFSETGFDINAFKNNLLKILEEPLGCRNENITKLEEKLEVKLPKSYVDFINANGIEYYNEIRIISCAFEPLLPISKVDYYSRISKKNLKFFLEGIIFSEDSIVRENYYSYNDFSEKFLQYNGLNRSSKLKSLNLALGELSFGFIKDKENSYSNCIVLDESSIATSVFLPDEKTLDGEFETWLLDAEDIIRFRSFAEFMISNLFFDYIVPSNIQPSEYLKRWGVDKILDFDILKDTA